MLYDGNTTDPYAVGQGDYDNELGRYGGFGEYPEADELGSIPMDELVGAFCPNCGGEQLGYYSQYPDNELIGRYCPLCNTVDGLGAEATEDGAGYYGQPPDHVLYGQYPDDDLRQAESANHNNIGYYGPYRDQDIGYYGQQPDYDDFGLFVPDIPPPFNPRCDYSGQLSGYEREKTVDPTCVIKSTVPTTPPSEVPDIFRPYL